MATLTQRFEFLISGLLGENENRPRHFGDRADSDDLTVTGQVFDTGNVIVADNFGTATLWQTGQGGLTAPAYILFISDKDIFIEIANTTPNPDERMLFEVKANALLAMPADVMGAYASNTSRLDGAVLVSATDYNAITEIKVQRDVADLVGDANVRLVLIV